MINGIQMKYRMPEKDDKPPEPWCRDMSDYKTHCPLCAAEGMVKISKVGRPFFSCRLCYTKLFMNSPRATTNFRFADRYFHAFENIFKAKLGQNYKRTIELGTDGTSQSVKIKRAEEISASYADRVKKEILGADLATREAILTAGRTCILCAGLSEWRQARKGHFQNCRFCGSQLFVNSPLGLAGLVTRREILLAMHRYYRETVNRKRLRPASGVSRIPTDRSQFQVETVPARAQGRLRQVSQGHRHATGDVPVNAQE
jgi:hypothetical protein